MTITLGRRVHYMLTVHEAATINGTRWVGFEHVGSHVVEGDLVSLDVTRVALDGTINGQAILDGNDSLWVVGASEGLEPGTWRWPKRE